MSKEQTTKTTEVATKTTKRPMKAPKTPRVKVPKQVALDFESKNLKDSLPQQEQTQEQVVVDSKENIKNENKNEMESANMENVKEINNVEEVQTQEEEVVEVPTHEEKTQELEMMDDEVKEDVEESIEEEEQESGILHREAFSSLPQSQQVKLMKEYRKNFPVEQIKKEMGHSTSSYYALMKRLGLHDAIARPLSQPRVSQKQKQQETKEITYQFTSEGVFFEGDLNIDSFLEQIEGFINLGGGEQNFEFNFTLIRK